MEFKHLDIDLPADGGLQALGGILSDLAGLQGAGMASVKLTNLPSATAEAIVRELREFDWMGIEIRES